MHVSYLVTMTRQFIKERSHLGIWKAWWAAYEAVEHTWSTVRRQREMNYEAASFILPFLFSLGPQPRGQCHPDSGWILFS